MPVKQTESVAVASTLGQPSSQYNLEVSDTELAVLIEESRIFINSIFINKSEHI